MKRQLYGPSANQIKQRFRPQLRTAPLKPLHTRWRLLAVQTFPSSAEDGSIEACGLQYSTTLFQQFPSSAEDGSIEAQPQHVDGWHTAAGFPSSAEDGSIEAVYVDLQRA